MVDQAETLRQLMHGRRETAGSPVAVFSGPGSSALVSRLAARIAADGGRAIAAHTGEGRVDLLLPAGSDRAQAVRLSERVEKSVLESLREGRGANLALVSGSSGAASASATLVSDDDDLAWHWPVYRSVVILTPARESIDSTVKKIADLGRDRYVTETHILVNGCESHHVSDRVFENLKNSAARIIDGKQYCLGSIEMMASGLEKKFGRDGGVLPNRKFLLDLDLGNTSRSSSLVKWATHPLHGVKA